MREDAPASHTCRNTKDGLLIDDLLNLSRLARTELHRQSLDVSALARSIASDLQKAQPQRQIELRIEDGLKTTADPGLLRVVLVNLLSNAWKFTSKRESSHIEFGMARGNGTPAYFVRDDGVDSIRPMPTGYSALSSDFMPRPILQDGHWPSHRATHRPPARRTHLGGKRGWPGRDFLFHDGRNGCLRSGL